MSFSENVDGRIRSLQEDLDKKQNDKFTLWMNGFLSRENLRVDNVCEDLRDGVKLTKLLEILTNETMGRTKGTNKLHRIDNVNRCLNALRRRKIRIEGISAEQVVAGSSKDIMALVSTIHQSHLGGKLGGGDVRQNDEDEDERHKQALLTWCKEKTKGYGRVNVKDFGRSWSNGLALNALVHSERPDLVDYESLKEEEGRENIAKAMDILEKQFWIMKIIGVEDVDRLEPDEKSILAYVALIFEAFYKNGRKISDSRTPPSPRPPAVPKAESRNETANGGHSTNGPQMLTLSSSGPIRPPRPMVVRMVSRKRESGGSTVVDSGPAAPAEPPPPVPTVVFEGSWECDYCAFANSPSTRICAMCYKAKMEKKAEERPQEPDVRQGNAEEEDEPSSDSREEPVEERIRVVQKKTRDEKEATEEPSFAARALRLLDQTYDGPSWECPGCHHRNPDTTGICGFCFRTPRQLKALSLEEMGVAKLAPAVSPRPPTGETEETP